MIIINIWNYLRGYVMIVVSGLKLERFLNLLTINNVYVWQIHRINYTNVELKMNYKDFRKIKDIAKQTESSVHIQRKIGVPFLYGSLKRKKILCTFFVVFTICIYYLTSRIWMIEVVGLSTVEPQKVVATLREIGLEEGISKNTIDQRYLEGKLLIKMPELSFAGVQIRGSKVIVECVERRIEPKIISNNEPCDIIANKSGIITDIYVMNGDGMVVIGDTVEEGQVLVKGEILREEQDVRFVHSIADVKARTWYEKVEIMPLEQKRYVKTGKEKTHFNFQLLNSRILKEKPAPYVEYNKVIGEKYIFKLGTFLFPIKVIRTEYIELKEVTQKYTVEEAKVKCKERLENMIKVEISEDAKLVKTDMEYVVEKNQVKAKIIAEVLETIGVESEINK